MSFKDAFNDTPAASGFALIDIGTYEAEITDVQLDLSSEPPRLKIEYTITQEPYIGRKQWGNYQLEGKGIGFLKKDMDTLQLGYDNIESPEDVFEIVNSAVHTPVVIWVNQKEYNGKMYNNPYLNDVLDKPAYTEATTTKKAPLNQKEADRLATKKQAERAQTKTKNSATQTTKKTTGKTQARKNTEPSYADADEVPF